MYQPVLLFVNILSKVLSKKPGLKESIIFVEMEDRECDKTDFLVQFSIGLFCSDFQKNDF